MFDYMSWQNVFLSSADFRCWVTTNVTMRVKQRDPGGENSDLQSTEDNSVLSYAVIQYSWCLIECRETVTLNLHRAVFQERRLGLKARMILIIVEDIPLCYRIDEQQ